MQKYYPKKKLLFFIIGFFFLFDFANFSLAEGLVPCGKGTDDPCTICHLIVGTKGLLDFGSGIIIVAAITGITIAGIIYIISSGNPALTKKAKDFVTSVIIGFAIYLGAWLIINVTMTLLSTKTDLGIEKTNWHTFSCSTTSSTTTATTGSGVPVVATTVTSGSLKFQTDKIATQYGDVSDDLQSLLNCLAEKLGGGTNFTINSISDNNGGGASCWKSHPSWPKCKTDSQESCCHHAKNSCHYGGTICAGKSYAIDVKEVSSTIDAAASACGAKKYPEGTHTHISIPGDCGCDAGL